MFPKLFSADKHKTQNLPRALATLPGNRILMQACIAAEAGDIHKTRLLLQKTTRFLDNRRIPHSPEQRSQRATIMRTALQRGIENLADACCKKQPVKWRVADSRSRSAKQPKHSTPGELNKAFEAALAAAECLIKKQSANGLPILFTVHNFLIRARDCSRQGACPNGQQKQRIDLLKQKVAQL